MRQLLMLGFYCEVYRREPLCRVYVNDVLVDEFNIPHAPRKNLDSNIDMNIDVLNPTNTKINHYPNFFRLISNNPFLKYIEFDDLDSKTLDVRIEVDNDDNNYSNGFISQCTLVMLSYIFLSSKKVLDRLGDIENKWKFNHKSYHINHKNKIDSYAFYFRQRTSIFMNFADDMKLNFGKVSEGMPSEQWLGKTGHFSLALKKKLVFWQLQTDLRKMRWKVGLSEAVRYLYDKYRQHEDPRSIDT